MNVSAIIVTRGDQDLSAIVSSLPSEWEAIIWDNGRKQVRMLGTSKNRTQGGFYFDDVSDMGAYGRYAAIDYGAGSLIYTQDDDCIVATKDFRRLLEAWRMETLVSLMPPSRTDYDDTVLVGWGSLFDRDLPARAFARWIDAGEEMKSEDFRIVGADFVFPMLTPQRIRLDAEHEDLPWAHAETRTWRRPDYHAVKANYLQKARAIRDA